MSTQPFLGPFSRCPLLHCARLGSGNCQGLQGNEGRTDTQTLWWVQGCSEIHQSDLSFDFSKIEAFYLKTDQDGSRESSLGKASAIVSARIIRGKNSKVIILGATFVRLVALRGKATCQEPRNTTESHSTTNLTQIYWEGYRTVAASAWVRSSRELSGRWALSKVSWGQSFLGQVPQLSKQKSI